MEKILQNKLCYSKNTQFIVFLLQYLKKNISIHGQLINSVLSLLLRVQLLKKISPSK